MLLFYQHDITQPLHTLDEEESKHCVRVLRMKTGDELHLTDGKGLLCEARILEDNPKHCVVEVTGSTFSQSRDQYRLHLAVAPTKNISRYEWFLEKATEVGVDEITPLICDYSERGSIKIDRLQRVLVAAMKQSLKSHLPILHEPVPFDSFIRKASAGDQFIAYCSDLYRGPLKSSYGKGSDCTILIGPEGDFSQREVDLAQAANYRPVSLGSSRLRTETAALVACHTIQLLNE